MQSRATPPEIHLWQQRGATRDANNIWRSHEGLMIAPLPLLNILIPDVHSFDHCARGEMLRKIKRQGFWSPYLWTRVDEFSNECEIMSEKEQKPQ